LSWHYARRSLPSHRLKNAPDDPPVPSLADPTTTGGVARSMFTYLIISNSPAIIRTNPWVSSTGC
jgi:hypothetical protein